MYRSEADSDGFSVSLRQFGFEQRNWALFARASFTLTLKSSRFFELIDRIPPVLRTTAGCATIQTFVAGAAAHHDGAAVMARGGIVLDLEREGGRGLLRRRR